MDCDFVQWHNDALCFLYSFPHKVKYMIHFSTPSKHRADIFISHKDKNLLQWQQTAQTL